MNEHCKKSRACTLHFFFAATALAQAAQSHYLEVHGVRMHMQAGSGETDVLLRGFGQTSHMWRPLTWTGEEHTVIARTARIRPQRAPADG